MIRVVNRRREPYDVYIDRDGNRDDVTRKYEAYLGSRSDLIARLLKRGASASAALAGGTKAFAQ